MTKKNYHFHPANSIEVLIKNTDQLFEQLKLNEAEIESIFANEKKLNPKLFNGLFFNLISFEFNSQNELKILGSFLEYKVLLAKKCSPQLNYNLNPLGVSGITFLKKGILLGKRANDVSHYAGYYEFIPSGSLENKLLPDQSSIDFKSQLIEELVEETFIPKNFISRIKPICLVHDTEANIYDVCCEIQLDLDENEALKYFSQSTEYATFEVIKVNELEPFFKQHNSMILPTTLALKDFLRA